MKWRSLLQSGLLLRTTLKELRGLRTALDQQNALLARLADRFAPAPPATVSQPAPLDTGVDAFDAIDGALVLDYIARCERDTGHTPDEGEILSWLADEKTIDLHARLRQREQEADARASRTRGRE